MTVPRCKRCGAGPLGNCGYYGCEIPRETCPLSEAERERLQLAARSPKRKPHVEQSGLADTPLFGTKSLL